MKDFSAEVLDSLRRLVRELRSESQAFEARLGITGAQLYVLRTLAETGGGSINDLAARTHTHQSSVSLVVAKLEKRKLVTRRPDVEDRRRRAVRATAAGLALLREPAFTVQERLRGALERLGAHRRELLATLLAELVDGANLSKDGPPPMFFEETTLADGLSS